MDPSCLQHVISPEERAQFERAGYLVIEDALSARQVERLTRIVDRLHADGQFVPPDSYAGIQDRLLHIGFHGMDQAFVDLIDHPRTFPKVWGLLGSNIFLYSTHLNITPPEEGPGEPADATRNWHQDSGWIGTNMREIEEQPRISLKVAYYLTDLSRPGRGNLWVIPGSQRRSSVELPAGGRGQPEGALQVCAPAGAAVLFDRRLWHDGSPNHSDITRKVLFYGYGYRWIRRRAKDETAIPDSVLDRADPIRRQLLGYEMATNKPAYTINDELPLRDWLREHLPEAAAR